MSQVNIGILLDEFEIHTPDDYLKLPGNKKLNFLDRVRSTTEHEVKDVLEQINQTPGLKMHFHVSRHPERGWQNIPNETFARKLAFFARKSVITFPFNEVAHWRKEDSEPLLILLCTVRPFLKEGLVNLLPSQNGIGATALSKFNNQYGLIPANFQLESLKEQFEEKFHHIPTIDLFLPHFENISPEEVIRIRRKEANLYAKLENRLAYILNGHENLTNEKTLLDELFQIDQHVRELTEAYEGIQAALRREDIYVLIGFTTCALVALFHPTSTLAPIVGSPTLFDVLKARVEAANKAQSLKEAEYYLLWRLGNPKAKI